MSSPKRRYQTARTLLEEIFGTKMHEEWPRKLLESTSCGDGFWETDGNGHYPYKGIMLDVVSGQTVNVICKYYAYARAFAYL